MTRALQNLPHLITYSYLDLKTIIDKISVLSHQDRSLILNESGSGSKIYYEGKRHKFKLDRLLSETCMAN